MKMTAVNNEVRFFEIADEQSLLQLTALGHGLGYEISIGPGDEYDAETDGVTCLRLYRKVKGTNLTDELVALAALYASAVKISPEDLGDLLAKRVRDVLAD